MDVGNEREGAVGGNALASGCHPGGWWCFLLRGDSLEENQIWDAGEGVISLGQGECEMPLRCPGRDVR